MTQREAKSLLKWVAAGSGVGVGVGGTTAVVHPDIETNKENVATSALLGGAFLGGMSGLGKRILQRKAGASKIREIPLNKKANLVRQYIDEQSNIH